MENSDPRHLLLETAEILRRLRIQYLVTGGMAVFVWGRPRFTADIDIVIELEEKHISELAEALKGLGEFGYVDENAMQEALLHNGEFNFIDGNTGVKVDFFIVDTHDPFVEAQMSGRKKKKILGKDIFFVSPEDLILSKLRWHGITPSSKQLEDVESIFKISGEKLDKEYLMEWAKKLRVSELLSPFLQK